MWNRHRRTRDLEECLLDQIERIVRVRRQPAREAIEPRVMCVEERGQPLSRELKGRGWNCARDWYAIHTRLNVWR